MSEDRDMPAPEMEGRDGMAAEYVLGTLPLPDRLEAERLIASDPSFAALVDAWTARLAPLNDDYAAIPPPPGVLGRTEARLFPVAAEKPARWRFWLGALGGVALAVLAAFALLPVLGPAPVIPTVTATLRGEGQPLIVSARYDATSQRLSVRRNEGPGAGQGNDYQLWLIPAGQAPVPLGLIREADLTIELASLPAGTTLAVSLEPAGGSPTGQPTGPVLISTVIPEA